MRAAPVSAPIPHLRLVSRQAAGQPAVRATAPAAGLPQLCVELLKRRGPPLESPLWLPLCGAPLTALLQAALQGDRPPAARLPAQRPALLSADRSADRSADLSADLSADDPPAAAPPRHDLTHAARPGPDDRLAALARRQVDGQSSAAIAWWGDGQGSAAIAWPGDPARRLVGGSAVDDDRLARQRSGLAPSMQEGGHALAGVAVAAA